MNWTFLGVVIVLLIWGILFEYPRLRPLGLMARFTYWLFFCFSLVLIAAHQMKVSLPLPTVFVIQVVSPWMKSLLWR